MSTAKRLHYSYAQYLRMLEESHLKLEYCEGVIYAMAGATPAHALLSAAAIRLLGSALLKRCSVSTSDLKVRIEATGLSTFPDASVLCGELQTAAIDSNAVINPTLLVEVTSDSTEDYDRGDKLSHYKQIPTLRAVLFVSHRTRSITLIERTGSAWDEREFRSGEEVQVSEPEVSVDVSALYSGITLDPK